MKRNKDLNIVSLFFLLFIVLAFKLNKGSTPQAIIIVPQPQAYFPVEGKILGIWSDNNNFKYYKDSLGYTWAVAGNKNTYTPCKAVFDRNIMEALSNDTLYWKGIVRDYDTKLYEIDEPLNNFEKWHYTKPSLIQAIINTAHFIQSYRPQSELRIGVSRTDISKYLEDYRYIAKQCSNVSFMYTSYDYPLLARLKAWKFVHDSLPPVKAYFINANYDYKNALFLALISNVQRLGANEIWIYCRDGEENLKTFNHYAFLSGWLSKENH